MPIQTPNMTKSCPDISVYPNINRPGRDAKADISIMEFFIEDASDPFHDPEDPPDEARLVHGLLAIMLLPRGISFAFTFSVHLCMWKVREVHLDHDGVLVTRFDYIKDSHYLLLALCTCCLSPAGM
jgi:hypothetical protein